VLVKNKVQNVIDVEQIAKELNYSSGMVQLQQQQVNIILFLFMNCSLHSYTHRYLICINLLINSRRNKSTLWRAAILRT